jgi:DNA gyrase/topoisomerase IV subunit A
MTFNQKIDEWIKEAEARPKSALTLLRLIAGRLRELTERNEGLLAENIALENGTRVEEYQERIAHLEYQLDLLKRRFGAQGLELEEIPVQTDEPATTSLLVYNGRGRILRVELTSDETEFGRLADKLDTNDEPPRLLAVPSNEEVLLLYSSGRVSTHSVHKLPAVEAGGEWSWEKAALPDEPRAGETLVCITPFSQLPVSDFFLQVSRRGNVKRTMTSMAQNVLSNHYIGKGALKKADQPFDLTLCNAGARLAFVTYEGKLLGLEIDDLSYTIEARITMSASDYVIASFLPRPEDALIFVTQMGKVLHRAGSVIETTKSAAAKGQALISANRLGQGVRFMGAAAVQDSDRVAVLDAGGQVVIYEANAMTGSGSIGSGELILSIGVIPSSFSGGGEPSNS